jgi:hypothetical protein
MVGILKISRNKPDVEVVLHVSESAPNEKKYLQRLMKSVPDGHVMAETLEHFDGYTGTRKEVLL